MSRTTQITLAIFPLLSPKRALANTKSQPNISKLIRSYQTLQNYRLKVDIKTKTACLLLCYKFHTIPERSQFDAEKPL